MRILFFILLTAALLVNRVPDSSAHFGMLIPSEPVVTPDKKSLDLTLSFSHPFENQGMDLANPAAFYVLSKGQKTDLKDRLQQIMVMDHIGWQAHFPVSRPGVYHFAMVPQPYWEPAEDLFIIHYTKLIVPAFGYDADWDEPLDLPTEIVPLLRPFGNYAGNSFSGQVLVHGAPLANAEVEVEFYNRDLKMQAPSDYHVTQLVKTDAQGVFTFTCPVAGWWGFAALSEADYTLKSAQGEEKPVELGAVLWIYLDDLISR